MKKMKGFTLIELLIMVAIIGILTALMIPMYQKARLEYKVRLALEETQMYKYEETDDPGIIKIRGKCLVCDGTTGKISLVQRMLNSSIRAEYSDERITVFILSHRLVLVGHYSLSKEAAYRHYVDTRIVYLPEKMAKWKFSVLVYDPSKTRRVGQIDDEKPNSHKIIAGFINSLARDDIIPPLPKDQVVVEELIPVKR